MAEPVNVTDHPLTGKFTIEPDGRWTHNGEVVTHERTWKYFSGSLRTDENGVIYITDGKVRVDIEVKDAPLVVTATRLTDQGLLLRFHDDTHGLLDPGTLRFKGNIPYCRVRDSLPAKFNTAAYIQLAEHIEERPDGFHLVLNGQSHRLPKQS